MVIVRLYGGLGNQMFQYAAALAVARRLETRLVVDKAWYDPGAHPAGMPPRPYRLDAFGISDGLRRHDRLFIKVVKPTVVREHGFAYDARVERVHGDVVLDGYWQSYRYFAAIESEVRQAFVFRGSLSSAAERLVGEVGAPGSVAVHVRRGDYAASEKLARIHGVLGPSYYDAAVSEVRQRQRSDLHLFVFSDDIAWCRDNLFDDVSDRVTFVDHTADYEDMLLMSRCRHHVVANSSFSWWGAWLGRNADSLVIAPARWFRDPEVDTSDLIPQDWRRL